MRREPKSASIRIAVLGAQGVGKTTLLKQFSRMYGTSSQRSVPDKFIDWPVTTILVDNKVFECTDVGSSFATDKGEQLATIHSHRVFVILYSIDDTESFKEMEKLKNIIESTADHSKSIVIVGNKLDRKRNIAEREIIDCIVTIDWEVPHVEICAKHGLNIVNVIDHVTSKGDLVITEHYLKQTMEFLNCTDVDTHRRHSVMILSICQQHQNRFKSWKTKVSRRKIARFSFSKKKTPCY